MHKSDEKWENWGKVPNSDEKCGKVGGSYTYLIIV